MVDGTHISDEDLLEIIRLGKESAFNYKQRRHSEWEETYQLYRNRIITNRLTQRQSVGLPLMKATIKTLEKDISEPPLLYFDCRANDEQKELYYNLTWKHYARINKHIIKDIIDKKQVMLYGRSFKRQTIYNGRHFYEVIDPMYIGVERHTDPSNINSARQIFHTGIYTPVTSLSMNKNLDPGAVARLKRFYAEKKGLYKSEENIQAVLDQNTRMRALGVPDVENPTLSEALVELNHNLIMLPNGDHEEYFFVITSVGDEGGQGHEILLRQPLEQVIGLTPDNFWRTNNPYTSWADDVERTDFWSDGVGDTLRGSNKLINVWYSQYSENRTLRSFGMNYYNSTESSFIPQTFVPEPWGWYPSPGNPNEIIKHVEIPDLSNSKDDIAFVMAIAEKAAAATATSQGQIQERKVTLGEIQLALTEAKERVKTMGIFYNDGYEDFGTKYTKLLEAAGHNLDEIEVTQKGRNTDKKYTRTIKYEDYVSEGGFTAEVKLVTDKSREDTEMLQKLGYAKTVFPNNRAFDRIQKRKTLEFVALQADEIKEVMEAEKQNEAAAIMAIETANAAAANGGAAPTNTAPAPEIAQPAAPPMQ